jgi:tripartite-type tricarboxylate transporter receptor subunit TctC
MKNLTLRKLVSTLLLLAAPLCASAADYPTGPIRLIVPFAPGGGNDTIARAVGKRMSESMGQQVIIENRAGANGIIGSELVAKSKPDGYTLLMANIGSHGVNPSLYKKLPYDAIRDFVPVSLLGTSPNVLVVHPSLNITTLPQLIAYGKANPGKLSYGSNGAGSSQHLAGALFATSFGLNMIHVPYKGTGPMMSDLVAGQINLSFGNIVAVLPYLKSKNLIPLAVTTPERVRSLPELPTLAETVPGFDAVVWWGIAVAKGTPPEIVTTLNREIRKALDATDTKTQLASAGVEPRGTTPEEFGAMIRSEITKWARVVKETGATAE